MAGLINYEHVALKRRRSALQEEGILDIVRCMVDLNTTQWQAVCQKECVQFSIVIGIGNKPRNLATNALNSWKRVVHGI